MCHFLMRHIYRGHACFMYSRSRLYFSKLIEIDDWHNHEYCTTHPHANSNVQRTPTQHQSSTTQWSKHAHQHSTRKLWTIASVNEVMYLSCFVCVSTDVFEYSCRQTDKIQLTLIFSWNFWDVAKTIEYLHLGDEPFLPRTSQLDCRHLHTMGIFFALPVRLKSISLGRDNLVTSTNNVNITQRWIQYLKISRVKVSKTSRIRMIQNSSYKYIFILFYEHSVFIYIYTNSVFCCISKP